MQGSSDTPSVYSEIRRGNLEKVREIIADNGLSHRPEWENGYTLLREALEKRQVDVAKFLIANGSKLNSVTSQIETSNTPLHIAVVNCGLDVVTLLVVNGANVNSVNKDGETPLHLAVRKKDVEVAELLVKHGANVNARGEGIMPVHIAVERQYFEIVEYYTKCGADAGSGYFISKFPEGYPPLHLAVINGSEEIVELLLSGGAGVNDEGNGESPLHIAAELGHLRIALNLIGHGANVNFQCTSKTNEGYTPMHFAVEKKNAEIEELLLHSGANVDVKAKDNVTPLHIAAWKGNSHIAEHLVRHGADVNCQCMLKSNEGYSPLHFAVEKGHKIIVELLLRSGANVNQVAKDNISPLHIAAGKGYSQICEHLMRQWANINCQYVKSMQVNEDYTPMQSTIEKRNKEMVELLLGSGANVNVKGKYDITPLHIASGKGCLQIAEHLLKHGADFNSTCSSSFCDGLTPLHFALIEGNNEVVSLLLRYGASADTQDKAGKTLLLLAVEMGDLAIVEHTLKHHPDMDNENNRYSLIAAVVGRGKEYAKITKNLLQYGFVVSPEHVNNQELLFSAVRKGYVNIVESLLTYGADVNKQYRCEPYSGCVNMVESLQNDGVDVNKPYNYKPHSRCVNIVDSLLQYGADVNEEYKYKPLPFLMIDVDGLTPLHVAVMSKQGEVSSLLVKFGADVNAQDGKGKAPIYYAINNSDLLVTKLLLFCKANLRLHPELLLMAAQKKSKKVIEVLLEHDIDVNFCDDEGRTALHCTASNFEFYKEESDIKVEIAKLLIRRGANVNAALKSGALPIHAAAENGYENLVRALLEYNTDVNSKDKKGVTSLHIAAKEGHVEVAETLLKFGAFVDSTDECGMTALHVACQEGHESVVLALLDHGSDINVTCKNNYTPLDFAKIEDSSFDEEYSDGGYSQCEEIINILENHIIKMETAHLYVSRENLSSISKHTPGKFQSECEDELASLSSVNVGNSRISWYEILTKSIHNLASLLGNENILQDLRSDDYKTKFPIYGSLIGSHFRMAERRKKLLEEVDEYCFYIFPELPWSCVWEVLSYLGDRDIRNLIYSFQLIKGGTPSTKTMME